MNTQSQNAKHTQGPWFVSGVRFKMNGGEWHGVNRYDESKKQDENIACVGFDPRTGDGLALARFIASAPELFEALKQCQNILGVLIDPANKGSGISNMVAWANCVAAETKARAVLAKVGAA